METNEGLTVLRVKREKPTAEESGAEKTSKAMATTEPNTEPVTRVTTVRSMGILVFHVDIGNNREYIVIGENSKRSALIIRNLTADTVWVGESGVIAGANGNGFPLRQWETLTLTCSYGAVYARTEANNSVIAVIEE